jgi:hypothetical protein
METITLDHDQYTESINTISDDATYRFALQAEEWWNRHFSWKQDGCRVLMDDSGTHLAYLFYKVDRYREYLTVHNLFTPEVYRHSGYALAMLEGLFEKQAEQHVKRFHMSCTPQALGFYARLPLVYWGVDETGNYHCDLPLPSDGIAGIAPMVQNESNQSLLGEKAEKIFRKVKGNGQHFESEKSSRFEKDKTWLDDAYRHKALQEIIG